MFFHATMESTGQWVVSVKSGEAVIAQGRAETIAVARELARRALETRSTVRPEAA